MGWLIALAVIVAVLWIPLGVTASYDESGAVVKLVLGFLRFQLYPGKPKGKKEKPEKPKKEKQPTKQPTAKEEKKGGSLSDFFPLVDVVLDFLSDIRRKLRVDLLELRFCMAGGDPADLGIQYGRTVAAVSAGFSAPQAVSRETSIRTDRAIAIIFFTFVFLLKI